MPKVLQRIQNLLNKVPVGEDSTNQLENQQKDLLQFCDSTLATSIRMEHAAIVQRISNLQVGLETWKQYLQRIEDLHKDYEEHLQKVQTYFENVQDIVTNNAQETTKSNSAVSNRLENLQRTRLRLIGTTKDLEQMGITQEKLKECVSHADIKTINQRMWLLWHQQGELDHQLAILCHQLEERLGLRTMFEARQSRFINWTNEIENRLDQHIEAGLLCIKDPEELLRKLETEFNAEMSLKEGEYNWLIQIGDNLVANCGDEYSSVVAKQNLQARVDQVRARWQWLETVGKTRVNKINDMMQTMTQLELRIAEIRAWLSQIEMQLTTPIVFRDTSKDTIDKKLQDHDKLKKAIEKESGDIGEVLNLCALLLNDADVWKTHFTIEYITLALQNIEERWKNVCAASADRKIKIIFSWQLLQEMLKYCEQDHWLADKEVKITQIDRTLLKDQIPDVISKIENLNKEIEARGPTFEILEQSYAKLLQTSDLDSENILELTNKPKLIILRWLILKTKPSELLEKFKKELSLYKDFLTAHSKSIIGLSKLDAQLIDLQLTSTDIHSPEAALKQLKMIEKEFNTLNPILEDADKLALLVMEKSQESDINKLQEMVDEYQLLWKSIQQKISKMKAELAHQKEIYKREVDESVQVETLSFEQDSAIQVNTLPLLERMTSISAKDAYIMELISALSEGTNNVNDLKDIILSDIPDQDSPELNSIGRRIGKLTAACQSSIELISHLHNMLIDECQATDEEAKTDEVNNLVREFSLLIETATKRQNAIRELSEAGRLLCPICTEHNWTQLENNLWRFETWLQGAEGMQSTQHSPPSNIEKLEDVIQEHKQFLLNLDSHRSILRSLNNVGVHLVDHTEDTTKAIQITGRLEENNRRWNTICHNATSWEILLQNALHDNHQFDTLVTDLCAWLIKIEKNIKACEPVDLSSDSATLESKYQRFKELRNELEHCEPRAISLYEAAKALFKDKNDLEKPKLTYVKLSELKMKLQSLIKLTGIYILKLGAVLDKDPNDISSPISSPSSFGTSLQTMSYDLQDQASTTPGPASTHDENITGGGTDEDENPTVLRRSCRLMGRVLRASVPIQVILLLMLGIASLLPSSEEDYSCSLVNTITNSFTPMLRYPDGPPPI